MPEIARLPQMCEYGKRKRFDYLYAKREADRLINKLLYQDHIEACPICKLAMKAETEWAKGQTEENQCQA